METRDCSTCRFFNRWAVNLMVFEDGSDNSVCRKHVWEYTTETSDEEMLRHIASGATCSKYIKRGG